MLLLLVSQLFFICKSKYHFASFLLSFHFQHVNIKLQGHIEKLMQAKNLSAEKKAEYQLILNQVLNFPII